MSESFNNSSIDIDLQVRLMNLVMGEASDFERDQLHMLMEQRTELAAYYQHLEHLHGLLCEVGSGEPSIDVDPSTSDDAWQLSADRRKHVLDVLDAPIPHSSTQVTLANKVEHKYWRVKAVEAVVVALIACVLIGLMLPARQGAREASRRLRVDLSEDTNDAYAFREVAPSSIKAAAPSPDHDALFTLPSIANSETNVPLGSVRVMGEHSSPADFAGLIPSRSTAGVPDVNLAVPGQTLPHSYYLWDDVQYFPAKPESRLPQEPAAPIADKFAIDGRRRRGDIYGNDNVDIGRNSAGGFGAGGMGGSGGGMGGGMGVPGGPSGGTYAGMGGMPGGGQPHAAYGPSAAYGGGGGGPSELVNGRSNEWAGRNATTDFGLGYANGDQNKSLASELGNKPSSVASPSIAAQPDVGIAGEIASSMDHWDRPAIAQSEANEKWFLNGRDKHLRDSQIPSPEISDWGKTGTNYADIATRISVPEDGTISMGGISRTRGDGIETSTLMMSVTPRIIIPDGEQKNLSDPIQPDALKALGQLDEVPAFEFKGEKDRAELSLHKSADIKKKADASKLEGLGKSLPEPVVAETGLAPDPNQNLDFVQAGELQSLDSKFVLQGLTVTESRAKGTETELQQRMVPARRQYVPVPSPELAYNARNRIDVEGKLSKPQQAVSLDEQSASSEAFSTFSLHVSDVSFKLAQTALSQGQWPEASKIRIEEFVNALDYHDPLPSDKQKIACRVEQAIHPFLMQRNLLRVSMRTAATGHSQNTPLRLTLLLDNSGSMERPDRRQAVLSAFQTLTQQLSAADQITLISFASKPRLLADKVSGDQREALMRLIENLPSEGGTNIEAALLLAREKATEQQLAGAQNRIVLLTDGAVNLGNANPDSLAKLVTQMRDAGIAFDAAGICALDLNDEVLEALTRQGDGRYYLLDSAASASERFAAQIAGALRPSAQNVKVQVEFNPQRVGRYKLLGFEKHRLNKEDFHNDQVDAAEMAAAEAGVAVYQFEIKPNGIGDVGSVSVRFRDLSSGQMIERRWPIPYESSAPRLEQAEASMQLAAGAALFAAKLGGGPLADSVELAPLQILLAKLPEQIATQPRAQQLRTMIDQAIAIGH